MNFDHRALDLETGFSKDFRQLTDDMGRKVLFHRAAVIADREDRRFVICVGLGSEERVERLEALDAAFFHKR